MLIRQRGEETGSTYLNSVNDFNKVVESLPLDFYP